VQGEHTGTAVEEIIKELEDIKTTVTKKELDFAKSLLIKNYPSQFETYSQLVRNMAMLKIHSLPIDYFNKYINSINNVTLESISQIAKKEIKLDELSTVLVGNKNSISEQVGPDFVELDSEGNKIG